MIGRRRHHCSLDSTMCCAEVSRGPISNEASLYEYQQLHSKNETTQGSEVICAQSRIRATTLTSTKLNTCSVYEIFPPASHSILRDGRASLLIFELT